MIESLRRFSWYEKLDHFHFALSLVAMMLASCETLPEGVSDAYNPLPANFAPPMTNTADYSEGEPVPGETKPRRP